MKDMKLGTKEIKLILYLGGVILALLVYEFFFTPRMEKINEMKSSNDTLTKQVNELQEKASKQSEYEKDIAQYQTDTQTILAKFPADVKAEDTILYSKEMQDTLNMKISAVNVSDGLLVYTFGQGSESKTASTTTASTDTTTEEDTETAASGGTSTTSGDLSTGSSSTASSSSWAGNVMLYKAPASLTFNIGYSDLKRMIPFVYSGKERCSLDTITLSYDTTTGNLVGTMDLGIYYLTGTDKTYSEPAINGVQTGQSNLFGSVQ